MPNFIDRLSERLSEPKTHAELRQTLTESATEQERSLQGLVKKHWHKLPKTKSAERRPAFAVDGSRAVRHLANGAYLFVAQALIVGEADGKREEETAADVQILPGAAETSFVDRFAELMMHRLEARLAEAHAAKMPGGSVLFLDGALYGQLPQLYEVLVEPEDSQADTKKMLNATVREIRRAYLQLFKMCEKRKLWLISIAKTSRDTTHTKVWWRAKHNEEMPRKLEVSVSEVLFRWTDRSTGYSTPILLGKRAFSKQPEFAVLSDVKGAPAIVSFFVRLADFDDALRIDVPAFCVGRSENIGDVETDEEILLDQPADLERVASILDILRADYGGLEVYNALMYSVDREVRLRQEIMDEVYLSLIQNTLGTDVEVRLDRSERRFHSR